MAKAQDAFRTISEVSEALDTPAHVLRFWESKFSQVKPVKRAGGRRYYRPDDLALLSGIKKLLHDQGMTIKGAQKLIRETGVKHVVSLGKEALGQWAEDVIDADMIAIADPEVAAALVAEPQVPKPPVETVIQDAPQVQPVLKSEPAPEMKSAMPPNAEVPLPPSVNKPAPTLTFAATPPPMANFTHPEQAKAISARFFESFAKVDTDNLRAQAGKIAPLISRLETIHAKMVRR